MYKELNRIVELTHDIDKLEKEILAHRKELETLLNRNPQKYNYTLYPTIYHKIGIKAFVKLFPHETPHILKERGQGHHSNEYVLRAEYMGIVFATDTFGDSELQELVGYERISSLRRKRSN